MNELIQEIITYLIITGTTFYTMYKTVLFFTPSQNKSSCSGCLSGNCGIKQNKVSKTKLFINIPNLDKPENRLNKIELRLNGIG